MDVDQSSEVQEKENSWNFKCNLCDETLHERRDFMKHKKLKHSDTLLPCEGFLKGECSRTDEMCWFKHSSPNPSSGLKSPSKKQDFQEVPQNTFPPDLVSKMLQMMDKLFMKVEQMEQRFQNLME